MNPFLWLIWGCALLALLSVATLVAIDLVERVREVRPHKAVCKTHCHGSR